MSILWCVLCVFFFCVVCRGCPFVVPGLPSSVRSSSGPLSVLSPGLPSFFFASGLFSCFVSACPLSACAPVVFGGHVVEVPRIQCRWNFMNGCGVSLAVHWNLSAMFLCKRGTPSCSPPVPVCIATGLGGNRTPLTLGDPGAVNPDTLCSLQRAAFPTLPSVVVHTHVHTHTHTHTHTRCYFMVLTGGTVCPTLSSQWSICAHPQAVAASSGILQVPHCATASEAHGQWCTVRDMMHEVRAKPLDHRTRPAGLETCVVTHPSTSQPPKPNAPPGRVSWGTARSYAMIAIIPEVCPGAAEALLRLWGVACQHC